MIDSITKFADRFVNDFSWGRLFRLTALAFIGLVALGWYESYTGFIRLSRIERVAALIEQIERMPVSDSGAGEDRLSDVRERLIDDLVEFSSGHSTPFNVSRTVLKVAVAAFPWVLFGSGMFFGGSKAGSVAAVCGMTVVAAPFVIGAAYLPDFERGWINMLLYPFGSMFAVMAFVIGFAAWLGRKKKAQPASRANAG